jgi:ribosomal protein S14
MQEKLKDIQGRYTASSRQIKIKDPHPYVYLTKLNPNNSSKIKTKQADFTNDESYEYNEEEKSENKRLVRESNRCILKTSKNSVINKLWWGRMKNGEKEKQRTSI